MLLDSTSNHSPGPVYVYVYMIACVHVSVLMHVLHTVHAISCTCVCVSMGDIPFVPVPMINGILPCMMQMSVEHTLSVSI